MWTNCHIFRAQKCPEYLCSRVNPNARVFPLQQERGLTTGWGLEPCIIRTQAIVGKPPPAYDPSFSCSLFWISMIVFLPSILALFPCGVSLWATAAHVFLKGGPAPAAASGIESSPGQSERCIPLSTVIGSGLDPGLRPGQ